MTRSDAPPPKSPKDAQSAARDARRAAALRENLKRRKAQIRGKEQAAAPDNTGSPESDGTG